MCGVECRVDARCDAFRLTDSHPVIHQSLSVGTRRDASEGFDQTKCAYGKKSRLDFFRVEFRPEIAGDFRCQPSAFGADPLLVREPEKRRVVQPKLTPDGEREKKIKRILRNLSSQTCDGHRRRSHRARPRFSRLRPPQRSPPPLATPHPPACPRGAPRCFCFRAVPAARTPRRACSSRWPPPGQTESPTCGPHFRGGTRLCPFAPSSPSDTPTSRTPRASQFCF